MSDLISRQAAIDSVCKYCEYYYNENIIQTIKDLPSAQPEPLTDKEQRIFLAAMGRERKVCKEVDDQYTHEPYEVMLTKVCSEIEPKVKAAEAVVNSLLVSSERKYVTLKQTAGKQEINYMSLKMVNMNHLLMYWIP